MSESKTVANSTPPKPAQKPSSKSVGEGKATRSPAEAGASDRFRRIIFQDIARGHVGWIALVVAAILIFTFLWADWSAIVRPLLRAVDETP